MVVLGNFLGIGLLTAGLLVVLYSIMPSTAWVGVIFVAAGVFILGEIYRDTLSKRGLRAYLPKLVNDYLTRTDMVDEFVTTLRENGAIPKMFRIMLIKWFDLSREEIVEVLTGVWPGFKQLSAEQSLLQFTPSWFRRMYSPTQPLTKQITVPEADEDFRLDTMDAAHSPRHQFMATPSSRGNYNMLPLVLWLAENRVRWAMSETLPMARRMLVRVLIPALTASLLWRRLPQSRRPMTGFLTLLIALYVLSVTRGLPASSERIFKLIRFSLYRRRGERPFRTNQTNGSLAALLYAFVEPFVPIVNTRPSSPGRKGLPMPPQSPAYSQASTLDQTVILDQQPSHT